MFTLLSTFTSWGMLKCHTLTKHTSHCEKSFPLQYYVSEGPQTERTLHSILTKGAVRSRETA